MFGVFFKSVIIVQSLFDLFQRAAKKLLTGFMFRCWQFAQVEAVSCELMNVEFGLNKVSLVTM